MRQILLVLFVLAVGLAVCSLSSCAAIRSGKNAPFVLVKESSGPTWRYRLHMPGEMYNNFKVGDMIRMRGVGIESADVTGSAKEKTSGAWRVVEVTPGLVVFRATCDAKVSTPFGYFLVKAPHAMEGTVHWVWEGQHMSGSGNPVPGPASVK